MSRAFMKESDDQWLSDVAPTLGALLLYLTRENNGITVVEEKRTIDGTGREVHYMTNGLAYVKDADGRWSLAQSQPAQPAQPDEPDEQGE